MKVVLVLVLPMLKLANALISTPNVFDNPIIQCAWDIQKKSTESVVLIAHTSATIDETNSLTSQLLATNQTVEIINIDREDSTNFVKIARKFFVHVLLLRTTEDYAHFLKLLYATAIWNPRGKYILLYTGSEGLLELFKMSWRKYVINIDTVMLVNNEPEVYTYFPYGNGKCGDDIQVEVLGQCGSVQDPFPRKVPADMNGCVIRAFANIYPPFVNDPFVFDDSASRAGYDMVILNNLVMRTNMTRTTLPMKGAFAQKYADGKFGGAMLYLTDDACDIALGSLFPNVSFFGDIDVTVFYHYVHFSWVVPAAGLGQQWHSIVLVFSYPLWLALLVILLGNIVIWWGFARGTSDRSQYEELSICMLNVWYALLQGSIHLPRSFTMRMLVLFWTLFSLLLATLYQSQLVSILLTPVYEHQVSNTRELVASSIRIVYQNDYLVRLNNSNKLVDREIAKKGTELSNDEHFDIDKKITNKEAFLESLQNIQYLIPRNYTLSTGKSVFYVFKDKEFGNPIAVFVKKGYPLLDRFDELMLRLLANGLVAKWIEDATFSRTTVANDGSPQQLHVNHLTGAFFVLMAGLTLAISLLIMEVIVHRYQESKRRN